MLEDGFQRVIHLLIVEAFIPVGSPLWAERVRTTQPRVIVHVLGKGIFLKKLVDGWEKLYGFLRLVLVFRVHSDSSELTRID